MYLFFCDTCTQAKYKLFYGCICKYCMHNRIVVHQRMHTVRGETLLFCKKEKPFYKCTSVCAFFCTKRAKNVMSEGICWVSMYSNVYNVWLWKTSRFSLNAFSLLYAPLLPLRSDVSHRSFFCSRCCCSVGPEVFAFSASVPCVNFCATMSEFLFCSFAPQNALRDSQRDRHRSQKWKDERSGGGSDTRGSHMLQWSDSCGNATYFIISKSFKN